jgi:hypothetical protein
MMPSKGLRRAGPYFMRPVLCSLQSAVVLWGFFLQRPHVCMLYAIMREPGWCRANSFDPKTPVELGNSVVAQARQQRITRHGTACCLMSAC